MAPTFFQKLEKRTPNVLPLLILLNLVVMGGVLFIVIFNGVISLSLARKPTPALVQMVDGKSIVAESVDSDYRTPENIHNFIAEILPLLRWESNKLPKEFAEAGENKLVRVPFLGVSVPRVNYAASFACSDGFMKAYLTSLPSLLKEHQRRGIKEVVLQISALAPPQVVNKAGSREWTVDVSATLKYFGDGNELLDIEAFNNRTHLKAVRQPKFVMEPTPAERLVNGIRAAGLEITLIEPLKE